MTFLLTMPVLTALLSWWERGVTKRMLTIEINLSASKMCCRFGELLTEPYRTLKKIVHVSFYTSVLCL